MIKWHNIFDDRILARGRDYWKDGAVHDLETDGERITALVDGTEEYEVEIELDDDSIRDLSCTCPYAEDGTPCKHMAAVLFAWEESGTSKTGKNAKKAQTSIQDLVARADEAAVRAFLVYVLEKDRRLAERFRLSVEPAKKNDLRQQKKTVDRIIRSHTVGNRYESWIDDYDDFARDIFSVFDNVIQPMMDEKQYDDALALSAYLFESVSGIDYADEEGNPLELEERCGLVWQRIFDESESSRPALFRWLLTSVEKIESFGGVCEEVLRQNYHTREYYPALLEWTGRRAEEAVRNVNSYHDSRRAESLLVKHLALMDEADVPTEQIRDTCRTYWKFPNVRRFYTDRCCRNGLYDEAVTVLKGSIKLDAKQYPGLISDYHLRLKEIYRALNRNEDYQNELWTLALYVMPCDLEIFRELKTLYSPEEWPIAREELFAVVSKRPGFDELLHEEELYDQLLDFLMDPSVSLNRLQAHEDVLKPRYPDQVLEKYRETLEEEAKNTATRGEYHRWVKRLKHMQSIRGGEQVVRIIVEDWRIRYRNRRAMMEELDELDL